MYIYIALCNTILSRPALPCKYGKDTVSYLALSHSRDDDCVTQQTCLLCDKAETSAVSHGKHVCCVTQATERQKTKFVL